MSSNFLVQYIFIMTKHVLTEQEFTKGMGQQVQECRRGGNLRSRISTRDASDGGQLTGMSITPIQVMAEQSGSLVGV